jgi:formate hydrogenlyase subunit 6/NADH:ubiquinone oxidoreductase subunit I
MPTIDPEEKHSTKCIACGFCASMCPCGALKICTWDEIAAAMAK